MKRVITFLIAAMLLFSLAGVSAAATPTFPDIKDEAVALDVAALQMLGVINGDGGYYRPGDTLTRAQFCKMAVIVMGKADQEPLYRGRTIFPDVRGDHWARGYINLAVSGEERIIIGNSDGTFRPDDNITFAQAVTILMRILGYADADAGMLWPQGYLDLALRIELTRTLSGLPSGGAITRAQAARLFCNLLTTPKKGGGAQYMSVLGSPAKDVFIMDLDVVGADGLSGGIKTSAGVVRSKTGIAPQAFLGKRGTLLTDANGLALTFIPGTGESRTVVAASANAGWILDTNGVKYNIPPGAAAYTPAEQSTFGEIFVDIGPGTQVTIFYASDGKADAVYINTAKSAEAVVVTNTASAALFSGITGGETGYRIYKNGVEVTLADVSKYDVATYNKGSKILAVSDFRLTGCYENVWPNREYPSRITVFGTEFTVMPSALESIAPFKIGEMMTLLFTADNQIAGAVAPDQARAAAIGIVDSVSTDSAAVTLLNGLRVSGAMNIAALDAERLRGELVTVVSLKPGQITLTRVTGSGASGELDLGKMTLSGVRVSQGVKLFERVGTGAVARIALTGLAQEKIPASKILYYGADSSGRVDTVILDDVTGDRYVYGFFKEGKREGSAGELTWSNATLSVVNGDGGTAPIETGYDFKDGAPGGLAASADGGRLCALVILTEVKNVPRAAFKTDGENVTCTAGGTLFPVSKDVQCYNKQTGTWFKSLADARAFSDTLIVYYDRPVTENGKIRLVIAG